MVRLTATWRVSVCSADQVNHGVLDYINRLIRTNLRIRPSANLGDKLIPTRVGSCSLKYSPRRNFGAKSDTVTGYSASLSVFLCQYHSTAVTYSVKRYLGLDKEPVRCRSFTEM
jgi:hypothetical protein